jgi:glycosyltransferase involved in cell wall biosynthesis
MGRRALRGTLRSADAVVALTRSWAAELSRFAAVDAYVIPNAPDIDPEPLARAAAGPPTVAYLGHLYADKGVYELVDAVAAVRRTHPDVRLVLAGQGRERERLLEVGRERLGDAVELPGWLMGPAKRELLATATCLALPSYHEGLPLVVLEAMHAGLPVVATPVGGVPEVARDGEEALLVPPRDVPALADALGRVLGDAGLRERLGAAARARAEAEYSVDAFRDRVGTLYRAVLER